MDGHREDGSVGDRDKHPDTLTSMNNLAFTRKEQGGNWRPSNSWRSVSNYTTGSWVLEHPRTLSSSTSLAEWKMIDSGGTCNATYNIVQQLISSLIFDRLMFHTK
jgi:hypothetical protein